MQGFKFGESREEKIDKFLDNAAWYYSSKPIFDQTASAVNKLTEELIQAGKSSDRLTEALNRISLWGVRVAVVGAIITIASLVFEIVKYCIDK